MVANLFCESCSVHTQRDTSHHVWPKHIHIISSQSSQYMGGWVKEENRAQCCLFNHLIEGAYTNIFTQYNLIRATVQTESINISFKETLFNPSA